MHQGITKPIGDLLSSASGDAAAVAQQIRKQEAERECGRRLAAGYGSSLLFLLLLRLLLLKQPSSA